MYARLHKRGILLTLIIKVNIWQPCLRKRVYVNKYVTANMCALCSACCKRVYVNGSARCCCALLLRAVAARSLRGGAHC